MFCHSYRRGKPGWPAALLVWILSAGLAGCAGSKPESEAEPVAPPAWYQESPPQAENGAILYGRGSGPSRRAARLAAYRAIAERIRVNVTSKSRLERVQKDGETARSFRNKIQAETDVDLTGVAIAREATKGGNVYVLARFDNRAPATVIAERLLGSMTGPPPDRVRWDAPDWLAQGPLLRDVSERIESRAAANAEAGDPRKVRLHAELSRQSETGDWMLQTGGITNRLHNFETTEIVSFPNRGDLQLSLHGPDGGRVGFRLVDGQAIALRVASPKARGYVSVFNAYPDGRVAVIQENATFSDGNLWIPTKAAQEEGSFLVAQTGEPDEVSRDLLIAIQTRVRLSASFLAKVKADAGMVTGEANYQLDAFIEWLANNNARAIGIVAQETRTVPAQ